MRPEEPSLTALGVAVARSTLDRPSTPTGDAAGEVALAHSLLGGRLEALRDRAEEHGGGEARDLLGWIGNRTAFFDQAVLRALDGGVRQVVIVAAGYDGRALRFRSPGVRFFEVDHPATQADKRRRLDELGISTGGITFVAADLTEPGLDDALAGAGHDADDRSLFTAEGLLRYLPEPSVRALLATLADRAAPGSELAVSISTRPPAETEEQAAARQRHEHRLAEAGEPVLTVPERDVALGWLAEAGWTVEDVAELSPDRPGRLVVRATRGPFDHSGRPVARTAR